MKKYDYFYEEEAEQFTFYRVPKILCTDEEFKDMSSDAKLLYGLLLDRLGLSIKNGWVDKVGRVYVIYTHANVKLSLCCADQKAVKLFNELIDYGLIERKKQGLGKPAIIYVKNFSKDLSKAQVQSCEKHKSRDVKSTSLELLKSQPNNNEYSNTDNNKTNPLHLEGEDERISYRCYFIRQLEFEYLKSVYPYQEPILEEIMEIIIDTVCSKQETILIAGDRKPIAVVKSRFMKLESSHIQYVMDCIEKNSTDIRSMKHYILAALYNASLTINSYYTAMYHADRANGRI